MEAGRGPSLSLAAMNNSWPSGFIGEDSRGNPAHKSGDGQETRRLPRTELDDELP